MSDIYFGQGRPIGGQRIGSLEGPLDPPEFPRVQEHIRRGWDPRDECAPQEPRCVVCKSRDDVQFNQPVIHPDDGVCFACRQGDE